MPTTIVVLFHDWIVICVYESGHCLCDASENKVDGLSVGDSAEGRRPEWGQRVWKESVSVAKQTTNDLKVGVRTTPIFIDFPCLLFLFTEEKKNTYHERHMLWSSKLLVQEIPYAFSSHRYWCPCEWACVTMLRSIYGIRWCCKAQWKSIHLKNIHKIYVRIEKAYGKRSSELCVYTRCVWVCLPLLIAISLGRSWRC